MVNKPIRSGFLFVSKKIYDAYIQGHIWHENDYYHVEIDSLLPAWITYEEKLLLEQCQTFEEIELFTEQVLDLKPIMGDKFQEWRQRI